ncbi:hypothetical protein GIB67_024835 [Kingdonia uniflora]|uniref:Kinesin motor domain-containing protein n=1 Tax=Kingdonia uniflora TaxID=39325 RepID=A0A7J7NYR3_9MAGN|nr:hypothetical protein GIB67_024835 [Kingdonia uniflora]
MDEYVVYRTEKQMKKLGDKVHADIKEMVELKLEELEYAISSESTHTMKDVMVSINQEVMELGQSFIANNLVLSGLHLAVTPVALWDLLIRQLMDKILALGLSLWNAKISYCEQVENIIRLRKVRGVEGSGRGGVTPRGGVQIVSKGCNSSSRMRARARFSRGSTRRGSALVEGGNVEVAHFEIVEDPLFWMDHNVQVLIRIRPISTMESTLQSHTKCLRQESAHTLTWLGHPETRFTFDHIACETVSQEKLFEIAGLPMVENCMSGYNSCMFAYGQTGSGKTYTMMGEIQEVDGQLNHDSGMTPRIFEYLFTRIRAEEENRRDENLKYSCKCSFLEIYNEHITDLLEPSSTNLQLREDILKGVHVENLTEYEVTTVKDVIELLLKGATNRKIAATNMNNESSRSHSVFTCVIESRWDVDSMTHYRFGRLNLVDLAGSERQKSSGAEGERLKEAANINKSLSTLGLVIMTLVDVAHGKHRHVPYRDSRLTFLLQDSLGGNSKTTIIANVSPSICSANETLSTLKFAQRAKLIRNNAKVNEDASGDVLALQRQIQQLKDQLAFLLKHQNFSNSLSPCLPKFEQSQSGDHCEGYDLFLGEPISDHQKNLSIPDKKMKCIEATLVGAIRREKMAEIAVRRLEAEIEHMNRLVHQREEDAQCTKMILKFREEKIKRLELLANGVVCADVYLTEENNALSKEIHLLHTRIDRNPELTRFALENIKLLEQLRIFQDFYEQGERETLLFEVSEMRDHLMEALKENCGQPKFPLRKENQEGNDRHNELEDCRRDLGACLEINNKLTSTFSLASFGFAFDREVGELQRELNKYTNCSTSAFDSVEDSLSRDAETINQTNIQISVDSIPVRTDSEDEVSSYDQVDDQFLPLKQDKKMSSALALQPIDLHKELRDAQSLIEAMEYEQLRLIEELDVLQKENCQYAEILRNKGYREVQPTLRRSSPKLKLDKMSGVLEKATLVNGPYQDVQASQLHHQNEVEEVCEQVEMEMAKTIIFLQEELATLQTEFHERLRYSAQENTRLRNVIASSEGKIRNLVEEWEKAILELTVFLDDGYKSLEDASDQIGSIASSFPKGKTWINEQVEKAAKTYIEKEKTIIQLQEQLRIAQKIGLEMKFKLNSLKGATLAITEVQQIESDEKIFKIQELESKLKDMEDHIIEAEKRAAAAFLVVKTLSNVPNDENEVKNCSFVEERSFLEPFTSENHDQLRLEMEEHSSQLNLLKTDKLLQPFQLGMEGSETGCASTREMACLTLDNTLLFADKKIKTASSFLIKFEEAHSTIKEADIMLNALLKANKDANRMTDKWKQVNEELVIERDSLIEEVQKLKSSVCQRDREQESLLDQIHLSLIEIMNLVSSLEESFMEMQRDIEERFKSVYSDINSVGHELLDRINKSRSPLEDTWFDIIEKGFTLFVLYQCYSKNLIEKLSSFKPGSFLDIKYSSGNIANEEEHDTVLNHDNLISENLSLERELARKDDLLKGLLFDFSLLQESTSNAKNNKDESEQTFAAMTIARDELAIAKVQLGDALVQNKKLKDLLYDQKVVLSISNSKLEQANETLDMLSNESAELRELLEDIFLKKTNAEEKLEEKDEVVRGLEKEILRLACSVEERILSSTEDMEDELRSISRERNQLREVVDSMNEKLDMAIALADENEAIAVEARQESEASKLYAEQKEEEAKILERSVEELEHTINVLETKVFEMSEEVEGHRLIRDDLKLELQALRQRMVSVENIAENRDTDHPKFEKQEGDPSSRTLELKKSKSRIMVLEKENVDQAKEIKECKDYISELVTHAEAQALQYQQKYKTLEEMVCEMKLDPSTFDKAEKVSAKPRGSSSPFRCISSLVHQINLEKDQELSTTRLRIIELEALSCSRQKEVCVLNARLAAAESMTHDVIRDLLGVKLDLSNYANLVDQYHVQKLVEEAQQQIADSVVKEREIFDLKKQIDNLIDERESRRGNGGGGGGGCRSRPNPGGSALVEFVLKTLNCLSYLSHGLIFPLVQFTNNSVWKTQVDMASMGRQRQQILEGTRLFSCIKEINQRGVHIFDAEVTLEQLRHRDQMLTAQNEMLKVDKANLKKKLAEMNEMAKKNIGTHQFQQRILQPRKMKENNILGANEDINRRLKDSGKHLSHVNDELARYRKNNSKDPYNRSTEEPTQMESK